MKPPRSAGGDDDETHPSENDGDPPALDSVAPGWAKRLAASARVAGSAARLAVQRSDREGAIGAALARELDSMKGVAMKLGQIVSYFDGLLPEETHAALHRLQRGSAPVKLERMQRVIEDAFGQPLAALFERFDTEPVAAASIGQVYQARFRGQQVAVKVQYPDIASTMSGDIGRLRALSRIASLATAVDGPSLVDELAERMQRECDYQLEAGYQRGFRAAFASDRAVFIPAVVAERSRLRVLTTEWVRGTSFYEFAAEADAATRSRAGLSMARFAYRSLFALGTLNADPHPGNYLFPDPHTVAFLDFGCVRAFAPDFLARERALIRTVIDERRADFRGALLATGMVPRPKRFDFDLHWQVLRHQYAPYRSPDFVFTSDYVRRGMEMNGPRNSNNRFMAIPPPWIWLQRLIWGLHAVLARLGAAGPFAAVLRDALDAPLRPLPPPPGAAAGDNNA